MELIIASALVLLAAVGLALGVLLRGQPLRNSCSGMSCLPYDTRCVGCPRRNAEDAAR